MRTIIIILFLLSTLPIQAQDAELRSKLPEGLGLSNQLRYSKDINSQRTIFENWFNLDYSYGIFTTGMRFDVLQPVNYSTNWSGRNERYSDIGFKYLKAELGDTEAGIEITVGNYYALFGRGMVLKSYEDRSLREDNNLSGVKVSGKYKNLSFTALSGMPDNKAGDRTDILNALDLEYRFVPQLKAGFSAATNQKQGQSTATTKLYSFRVQPSVSFADMYFEYGLKKDDDENRDNFQSKESFTGKAFYGNLNLFAENISVSGEYKYYDNFSFTTGNGTVSYNTPPATRKDYSYYLLNRHTTPLDAANETGFMVEANYQYFEQSSLTLMYGVTNTLESGSYFYRSRNKNIPSTQEFKSFTQLREVFAQLSHHVSDQLLVNAAFGYNEESKDSTKNITPIIEAKYYLDETNTLRIIIEHQYTTERKNTAHYYTDAVLLEYLNSPSLSISLLSELATHENTDGNLKRKMWNLVQFGYQIGEHTDLQLLLGSRQAGVICIGGVCRYEPEFNGVELKMINRF